jgi:hypothetical protein
VGEKGHDCVRNQTLRAQSMIGDAYLNNVLERVPMQAAARLDQLLTQRWKLSLA